VGTTRVGWWLRATAALLDAVIMWALAMLGAWTTHLSVHEPRLLLGLALCVAYLLATLARAGARNGQTLGKQAAGIRVVRDDGAQVNFGVVLWREVVLKVVLAGATGIGWLVDAAWPLFDGERRALHDRAARTRVVPAGARTARTRPVPPPAPPAPLAALEAAASPARRFVATLPAGVVTGARFAAPDPLGALAPVFRDHLRAARNAERRIKDTIRWTGRSCRELEREVDALLALLGRTAERAQLLHDALKRLPVSRVEAQLAEARSALAIEALQEQLAVQRRMRAQLQRFHDEFDRLVAGLDEIRVALEELGDEDDLAAAVRNLHEHMSSVAAGIAFAFA
jgi:uncharacterized RDD family membrane protein YckC